MSTNSSLVNLDGWIKVASKRSRSLRGPGTKSLDGTNLLDLFQEVKAESGESPEFRSLTRKTRSYPALRIKSRSRGRRRDGRKRSGSKQSSVLEALAVAQLSDSILNESNSPIEATLEEEDDDFMNPTKPPKRRLNSDWVIESPSKVFLRRPRTDDLRSSSGVFSESTSTTLTSTFDDEQPALENASFNSKLPLSPMTFTISDISDDLRSLSLASTSPSPFMFPPSSSSSASSPTPFMDDSSTLFSSMWRHDAPKPVIASSLDIQKCPLAHERRLCSSTCPYVHPGPTDNDTIARTDNLVDGILLNGFTDDVFVSDSSKASMLLNKWPSINCFRAEAFASHRDQEYWNSIQEVFNTAPRESVWPEAGGEPNPEASFEPEPTPSLDFLNWLLSRDKPEGSLGIPFSPFITDDLAQRHARERRP